MTAILPQKRPNLLIVCAGDASLHTHWFLENRSYDIMTIYFGDDEQIATQYQAHSDYFFQQKGLKIELARKVLLHHLLFEQQFQFQDYEYIWFPDDDMRFERHEAIEDLFALAYASQCQVFQPAIQNEYYSKGWESTRQLVGAFAHKVNLVELMAHGFSGQFFQQCYLTAVHTCEFMKSGWGLEPYWLKIGEALYRNDIKTFVFDCCPIIHTRPLGSGNSTVHLLGQYESGWIPHIHIHQMHTQKVYANLFELLSDNHHPLNTYNETVNQLHEFLFHNWLSQKNSNT